LLTEQFQRDYGRLTPEQKRLFKVAVLKLIEDLRANRNIRSGLRVKGIKQTPGVLEMTWAPDGRATFEYGDEIHPGEPHIVWRRVGTHSILP
jgi:hypothetical protein